MVTSPSRLQLDQEAPGPDNYGVSRRISAEGSKLMLDLFSKDGPNMKSSPTADGRNPALGNHG